MQHPPSNGTGTLGIGQVSPDGRWRWNGVQWLAEPTGAITYEATYNPILGVTEPQGLFAVRPRERAGVALVMLRDNQRAEVVWPSNGGPAEPGPPFRGRPRTIYQVDVADHHLEVTCELPSEEAAHCFQATLHVTCTVSSPEEIVRRSIRDAGAALWPSLEEVMRRVCRRHELADCARAEDDVRAELRRHEADQGFHPGFHVSRLAPWLDIDPMAHLHADEKRQERHETEMAQRELNRSEFYRHLIDDGDWGALRLALAQNRKQLPRVLQAMREGDEKRFQNNYQAIKFLVEQRIIGPEDLELLAERMGVDLSRLLRKPKVLASPPDAKSDTDDD